MELKIHERDIEFFVYKLNGAGYTITESKKTDDRFTLIYRERMKIREIPRTNSCPAMIQQRPHRQRFKKTIAFINKIDFSEIIKCALNSMSWNGI
jgi:hypothetical protein